MYRRVKQLLSLVMTTACFAAVIATPASAQGATKGIPVLDFAGRPVKAASVLGAGNIGTRAVTPGPTFDAYIGNVRVHFANAYQWLDAGQTWAFGNSRLTMQTNGNLVIYHRNGGALRWQSGTTGNPYNVMYFQPDANLVLYAPGTVWGHSVSNTYNGCASYEVPLLGLQSDSNFVIYCGYTVAGELIVRAIWATGTVM